MECACCNKSFSNGDKTFVWKERHTNLIKSEVTGFSRRDTYRYAEFEDDVCENCYRKLKRNSIIVPVVSWLLLFAAPLCSFFFCNNFPVLQHCLYIVPGLIVLLCLVDRDMYYSFIGLLLRPILGVYNLHPLGQRVTRNLQKEYDREERAERKSEDVIRVLSKKYHISESEAFMVVTLSDIGDRIEKDKGIQRLSARKIVDLYVPDRETLNTYLKDLTKFAQSSCVATDTDKYIERINQAMKEKRLYGLDVEDILKEIVEK